jgi:dTDP-glucose 4,6-dehydratase
MSLKINPKKFLVIGSNSFSGSHFVNQLLLKGNQVCGVSRSAEPDKVFLPYKWGENIVHINDSKKTIDNFKFYSLDLNTSINKIDNLLDEFQPEYVVNFASQGMVAQSWLNPTHWYQTNVVSQVALHDVLRKKNFLKKYVHVTTPEVYGSTDKGWMKESFNFNPTTPYAVSRAACDMHLMSFLKAYDFPVVFTRAANVYGPGQQLYRVIPRALLSALTGKTFNLNGGGLSKRSFIYIEDVVNATIDITLKAEPGSSWHISTNEALSIKELIHKICTLTKVNFQEIVNIDEERLGKDQNYLLDSEKIRSIFNWEDKVNLDEGITKTLNWVKSNLVALKELPWEYQHKS